MTRERPVIVVGCPRSGTTLLQLMLHAHPRIAIPPENRFVLPAYQRRRQFGDLGDADNRRRLAEWIATSRGTKFDDFKVDTEQVTKAAAAASPTLGSVLGAVFRTYAQRFGKPRWGDKRPAYITNLDTIRQLFPLAQVVNIVRDGRDCVASLKEMRWHRGGVMQAASMWARAVDHARRAARVWGPDSFCELSYEQLVEDPEAELTRLCAFLGEDYDPAMTVPAEQASLVVPKRKRHHALVRKQVTAARIGGWRERLEPWEASLCEAVLGGRLRAKGYELSQVPPPSWQTRWRYERLALRHRFAVPRLAVLRTYDRLRRTSTVADQD